VVAEDKTAHGSKKDFETAEALIDAIFPSGGMKDRRG
jgi:hypothetical protein